MSRYSKGNNGRLSAMNHNSYYNNKLSITDQNLDSYMQQRPLKSVQLRSSHQPSPIKPSIALKVNGPLLTPPKPMITAKALQKKLQLEDLEGEGGYFRRIYESDAKVGSGNFAATSIYFMLTPDQPVSHLHRLKSDEIWHFYAGKSITIIEIRDGKLKTTVLGNDLQAVMEDRMVMSYTVKAGAWFGSYLNTKNEFAVVGCTVVPGFNFSEFEVLYHNKVDGIEIPKDL